MRNSLRTTVPTIVLVAAGLTGLAVGQQPLSKDVIAENAQAMLEQGRKIFRFDTFGDEAFWGDTLKLHQAISTVSPRTALAVGLKVDVDALPQTIVDGIKGGTVDLADPATTLALLKLNAVVGVTGFTGSGGKLRSMGIQCALCHST